MGRSSMRFMYPAICSFPQDPRLCGRSLLVMTGGEVRRLFPHDTFCYPVLPICGFLSVPHPLFYDAADFKLGRSSSADAHPPVTVKSS